MDDQTYRDLAATGAKYRSWRYATAGAAAAVVLVAGYLALANVLAWAPLGKSRVETPPASPASPTPAASGSPEDTPVESVAAVGSMGLPLEAPDCTTHPEGAPLGQMRFAYIQGNPWQTDFNTRCVPM
ncbi:MAG: hypothetical protein V3U95_04575, partial [Dehalococcoidia bacterium]